MRGVLLAGCMLALWPGQDAAAADATAASPGLPPGTVHTQATAHRRLPNTVAEIELGIEVEGRDLATVRRQLGERSRALLDYLRAAGAQRLTTTTLAVETETHSAAGRETIVGYVGRANVRCHVAAAQAGPLVSSSLTNGANTLRGVRFAPSEADTEKARRELAVEATRTALDAASAVAAVAGEHVLGVREIDLSPEPPSVGGYGPMAAPPRSMATEPVATEPGEQDVSVTVDVKIAIGRAG
jgi:uncharacterized protein YggE